MAYIKFNNLPGRKIHRLLVLELIKSNGKDQTQVRCLCDCGNICQVRAHDIAKGDTRSCGCAKKARVKHSFMRTSDNITLSTWYNNAKKGASRRKYTWNLTKEECWTLITKPCFYCGYHERTVGIDRVDNNQGYLTSNVVPCCRVCNFMKRDLTISQFLEHCKKVVSFSL